MAASILRKIEKILAIAEHENTTLEEAANAAAIAKKLADKYNIAIEILKEKGSYDLDDSIIDYLKAYGEPFRSNMKTWELLLAKTVAEHHSCRVFSVAKNGVSQLNIVGHSTDIELTEKIYSWLHVQLTNLILAEGFSSSDWIESFAYGAIHCINTRLLKARDDTKKEIAEKISESSNALVKLEQRLVKVDAFLKQTQFSTNKINIERTMAFRKGFNKANIITIDNLKLRGETHDASSKK